MPAASGATPDRLRILSVDGGGIRGLIPALVIADLERRVADVAGERRAMSDCFHLLSGTSTGGLIALGLTAPHPDDPARPRMDAERLVRLYRDRGPEIFAFGWHRLLSLNGWIGPKHSPKPLRRALEEEIGPTRLAQALREVVVTAYDMTGREPHFFKRWRAREEVQSDRPEGPRNPTVVAAGMATAAAPTYFPSFEHDDRALVDGGVFASNPTVAAVAEALKRSEQEPSDLRPHDLFVVSIGTGVHEAGFEPDEVAGWGRIGWVLPHGGEPPLIGAMLDGQSDAADHWAHMLLNHEPGEPPPEASEIGHGPRYFRLQTKLPDSLAMDDASGSALDALAAAAESLIADNEAMLDEIARRLAGQAALEPDPLDGDDSQGDDARDEPG